MKYLIFVLLLSGCNSIEKQSLPILETYENDIRLYTIRCEDGSGYGVILNQHWIKEIDAKKFCSNKPEMDVLYHWNGTYYRKSKVTSEEYL